MASFKKKILLVGEAVTISHVARLIGLTQHIPHDQYSVFYAFDKRYRSLMSKSQDYLEISSIEPEKFRACVDRYSFPYTFEDLVEYVHNELKLIERVDPDLIIGDFRITLAISARLKRKKYFSIVNSYWIPEFPLPRDPPDHFLLRWAPKPIQNQLFRLFGPLAYRLEARTFNNVAHHFGVQSAKGSLLKVYTQADHILIPEPKLWTPELKIENATFIGPLYWATHNPDRPSWWNTWNRKQPTILISAGSSGAEEIVETSLKALENFTGQILVASKKAPTSVSSKHKVFWSDFFPLTEALPYCQLLISNGGSMSMADALRYGVPVIGLTSNYDQYLSAQYMQQRGAGDSFLFRTVQLRELTKSIEKWLNPSSVQTQQLEEFKQMFSKSKNHICELSPLIHS